MNGSGQRAARTALDAARSSVEDLDRAASPEDAAACIIEAWSSIEQGLQALAGTRALVGQPLLRELRQRELLSLGEAHTLVDLGALAERVRAVDYAPTTRDRELTHAGLDEALRVVERGGKPGIGHVAATPTPARDDATPSSAAPLPHLPTTTASSNLMGRAVVIVAALAVIGGGGYAIYAMRGRPDDLRRGRAAYAAGDRLTAVNAFQAAAGAHPALAEPHLYLGRIARESGNLTLANEELRRAVALEPDNYLTHRELASLLLLQQRPDLARTFYERAIRLKPEDRTSLGYMGCTLLLLGQAELANRFLARAGAGPWTTCVPPVPVAGAPAAPPR